MERTLSNFIRALRNAEVRVSTAETLDAFNTMELVGYRDRAFLKDALSMVLPKTADEKEIVQRVLRFSFSRSRSSKPTRPAQKIRNPMLTGPKRGKTRMGTMPKAVKAPRGAAKVPVAKAAVSEVEEERPR